MQGARAWSRAPESQAVDRAESEIQAIVRSDRARENDIAATGVVAIVGAVDEEMFIQIELYGLNLLLRAGLRGNPVASGVLRSRAEGRTTRWLLPVRSGGRSGSDPQCQQRCKKAQRRVRRALSGAPDWTKDVEQAGGALSGSLVSRCGFDAHVRKLLQRTIRNQSLWSLRKRE